ncbi:hypothetical protein [Burkholderia lata]|uniref:hypothetical protein n=1 Tax=Burkholderia lata (strain ATCC 17760 / DSM 23089 / LMG 22485 / NCIMB 9086 / R18194 / 383) TaxID=482957 RepID=UPI0014535979|nr:hypothetical protein [Burkholderia lata]VWB67896.1 hypothetical protein BLA15816_03216 [Burkholderia lata]
MANYNADAAGIFEFLADRLDVKQLAEEDLNFLSCANEQAVREARNLSDVVSGIGCLISEDQTRDGAKSGSLWSDDVPTLLWLIAGQIGIIGKLANLGGEVDWELRRRAEESGRSKEVHHG